MRDARQVQRYGQLQGECRRGGQRHTPSVLAGAHLVHDLHARREDRPAVGRDNVRAVDLRRPA